MIYGKPSQMMYGKWLANELCEMFRKWIIRNVSQMIYAKCFANELWKCFANALFKNASQIIGNTQKDHLSLNGEFTIPVKELKMLNNDWFKKYIN